MKKKSLVSIVVATKNEQKNIAACLQSIKNQTYPSDLIEIIVVDNNSIDQTKKTALQFTKNVYNKGPERSAQRNWGIIEKAHGEYAIFLDADMRLGTKTIEACVLKMENDRKLVGLYISEIITGEKFWSRVRRFERSFYDATVIDGLRFFRRDIFKKIGGFDESLYACEDWDLDKRIKKTGAVGLITEPVYHDESEVGIAKYISKKGYYAKNFDTYIEKWERGDVDVKKQFGLGYRFFWVFVEQGKWKKIIFHPLLAFVLFFVKFMVGFTYLTRKHGK